MRLHEREAEQIARWAVSTWLDISAKYPEAIAAMFVQDATRAERILIGKFIGKKVRRLRRRVRNPLEKK